MIHEICVHDDNLVDAAMWLNEHLKFQPIAGEEFEGRSDITWSCSMPIGATKWLFRIKEHDEIALLFKLTWAG